jgi:hypothetical protein
MRCAKMKLVTLETFANQVSKDGAIDARTVRRWINNGDWPMHAAAKRGKRWFIDLDKLETEPDTKLVDFLTDGATKKKC